MQELHSMNDENKSYKQHLEAEFESIISLFTIIFKFTRTYRCLKRRLKFLSDLKIFYFSKIKTPFNYIILCLLTVFLICFLIQIFTYDDVKAAVEAQNLKFSITCDESLSNTTKLSCYGYHANYLDTYLNHFNFKTNETCICKLVGHCLARKPPIDFNIYTSSLEFSQFKEFYMHPVRLGGYWKPPNCAPDYYSDRHTTTIDKVTFIIVPYLNRYENLRELLFNLHPFLQRQYINYRIVVVEQSNIQQSFNKGRLYNTAFNFLRALYSNKSKELPNLSEFLDIQSIRNEILNVHNGNEVEFNCMILHDVDLLPEHDYNIYECDDFKPRHLSLMIRRNEALGYHKNLYELLVGGVLAIKPHIYEKINGFSNEYWKWGAEDDGKLIFDIAIF